MDWVSHIDILNSKPNSRRLMPHQQAAVDAMNNYFDLLGENKGPQSGLVIMPTGSGKTFTSVHWLLNSGIANGYKIVWLVHRQELITQTFIEFEDQAPNLAEFDTKRLRMIAISGAHYHMSQASRYDVNIISISSIANKYGYRFIRRMLGENGMRKLIVVIDEAHHSISPSYQKVLKRISELNPNRILLGLTATPTRMQEQDRSKLMKVFNVDVNKKLSIGTKKGYVYEETLKNLIVKGSLAKPIYKRIETEISADTEYEFTPEDDEFFNQFGELSENIKSQIAKSSTRNKVILEHYLNNKEKYGKTLIFAVNQLHCRLLYEEFNKAGINCDYVISDKSGNQETIAKFKANKIDVLINVQILTEGSDVPNIQTVFLTRQTNSDSLLMQMVGRGLRGPLAGGTREAYIVDFHDTWEKFSFWLDPKGLDIFDIEKDDWEDEIKSADSEKNQELDKDEKIDDLDKISIEKDYDIWDVYLRIYKGLRSNVIEKLTRKYFLAVGML